MRCLLVLGTLAILGYFAAESCGQDEIIINVTGVRREHKPDNVLEQRLKITGVLAVETSEDYDLAVHTIDVWTTSNWGTGLVWDEDAGKYVTKTGWLQMDRIHTEQVIGKGTLDFSFYTPYVDYSNIDGFPTHEGSKDWDIAVRARSYQDNVDAHKFDNVELQFD